MRPEDAHFGVKIDFVRGKSDPVQVFAAMTDMLRGFSEIDRQLIGIIEPSANPMTVIEDIEAASITAWVRNVLTKADDKAIESMDVKKAIGVYLVKAKYKVIEFLDDIKRREDKRRREQLKEDLQALAREVPSSAMFPGQIDLPALEKPMNDIQLAKSRLQNGEKVTIKGEDHPEVQVDTAFAEKIDLSDKEPEVSDDDGGYAEMLLLIRKPDLIGKSKWEFKHGKQTINATINDTEWMAGFHRGEEKGIVPGTEMRARVHLTYQRNADGALSGVEHEVEKVLGIVPPSASTQRALFADD